MKIRPMSDTIKDVVGGTPAEVLVKIGIGAFAALWANLEIIGLAVFGYFILLIVDAGMGSAIAMSKGIKFSTKYFMWGPLKKFLLTAGMLMTAAVVDSAIVGNLIFPGVVAFIFAATLIDVAKKYGTLTGSKLVKWLEEKLGSFVKTKDEE